MTFLTAVLPDITALAVNYTPVGDVSVLALCILCFLLLVQNYIHRSKSFRLMLFMLCNTCIAAITQLISTVNLELPGNLPVYVFRLVHYIVLILNLYLYLHYLQGPFFLRKERVKAASVFGLVLQAVVVVVDVIGTICKFGYYIMPDGSEHHGVNVFLIEYAVFSVTLFYTIFRYRSRIIRQVYIGLLSSNILSLVILIVQGLFGQYSYTSVANFLLVLSIVYMFHSNSFDVNTGAVAGSYFYEEMDDNLEKGKTMIIMSYNIPNFSKILNQSKDLRKEFNHFFQQNLTGGILYHLNDRLVLVFEKKYNLTQDRIIEQLIEDFKESHRKFAIDYKLVLLETTQDVPYGEDYIRLIEFAEQGIPNNTIYMVNDNDIQRYYRSSYILSELEDIAQRHDLDDPRILVYCQPVYNIASGEYDTAEALMRMKLEKTGMVFPDQFISLAEQHGLIHTISLIILNKTCGSIRTLLEDGFKISRISVNFSTMDIRYEDFCKEVQQIIARNQIPYEKIAIEITESRSEADFNLMKEKVIELQKLGIKFYLDDFGTGYSNFERIMEIPFDIIKFDRSMLIESGKSESSYYMVSTFASMFDKLKYSVLFEGIEDDSDEANCVQMSAKYLQGYKYSKPIPIEQLCNFLERDSIVEEV